MKLTRISVLMASLALAPAALAQQLLGVGNFGNAFQTQSLYSIDTTTGAATLIGGTGLAQISGIAYDGSTLYAYTVAADLYTINITTGASTLVAAQANTVPEGDLSFANGSLMLLSGSGVLSRVNSTTAALTTVANIGTTGQDFSGLAALGGNNYAALALNNTAADTLVGFDSASGLSASQPVISQGTSIAGMVYTGSTLYATNGSQLFTFTPGSGGTLIGTHGVSGFSGLAFIPSPSAAAILALAGLSAARRRR
jgi:hypothetical protein